MKYFTVNLKEQYPICGGELKCICMDAPFDGQPNWQRPALIVCPGGGYNEVCSNEGEVVATKFFAKGFQAFVLNYNVHKDGYVYPTQLLQLACAVDYVKTHAMELRVNPAEIFVIGFSAGGHLAGNLAVQWQDVSKLLGKSIDCKPTAVGLCYPVINRELGHVGSHDNLLDGYADEQKQQLYEKLNLNNAVTKDTPPAFIWSTAQDTIVPCQNALSMALAYANCGVNCELHLYACGEHGLSTCDREVNFQNENTLRNGKWIDDCCAFFRLFTAEQF